MAYKKSYRNYKAKGYHAKKGQKRGAIYGAAAGQLYKDVQTLKNLINVEFKYYETNQINITASAAGNVPVILNSVPQGDTSITRDGMQFRLKSMQTEGSLRWGGVNASDHVRFMWIIDTKPDGSAPAWSDIINNVSVYGLRNLNNKSRFVILKDKHLIVSANTPEIRLKMYRKMDMITIQDTSSGGTFSNVKNHALFFAVISQSLANAPTFTAYHRIRFVDN